MTEGVATYPSLRTTPSHASPSSGTAHAVTFGAALAIVALVVVSSLGIGPTSLAHGAPTTGPARAAAAAATPAASPSYPGLPGPARPGTNAVLATINVANQSFTPGPTANTKNFPSPSSASYDSGNHRAYVLGSFDQVLVVNEATRATEGTISVGLSPLSVLYAPGTGEVFVANFGSNDVSIINDTSELVVATVPIPSNLTGVNSTPDLLLWDGVNHTVLVQEYDQGSALTTLAVLDPTTNAVRDLIPGIPRPQDLAFNPQTDLLYDLVAVSSSVVILNLSSGVVQGTWSLPSIGYPTGVTVDTVNGLIFVGTTSYSEWANVTVFSAYTGQNLRNITVFSGATTFGPSRPVYASATGTVYLTASNGLLYTIGAVTFALSPGTLDGICLGAMVLSGSGAPLLLPDPCANALSWVDGVTAVVLATTPTGATPTDVTQVPSSGALAILEPQSQRVDFVNSSTLAFASEAYFPSEVPILATSDPTTRWAYSAELSASGSRVTALDPDSGAIIWSWLACGNCQIEGLGDQNGSVLVSEYRAAPSGQLLTVLNASTGAVSATWPLAYFGSGAWDHSTRAVVTGVVNSTAVLTSIPGINLTVEVDRVSGQIGWARPTGENMSGAVVLGDNATVVLASGNDTGELEFVQLVDGAWIRGVPLATPADALATDATGTTLFLDRNGSVYEMNASGSTVVGVPLPAGAAAVTLRYLAADGGIAVPAPALGAVLWVGAPVSVAGVGVSSTVEQATPLTLVTTAIGGFGAYHYNYSGLPFGCPNDDLATFTCTPLDSGPVQITVTVTDATPAGTASGVDAFTLTPYPISASISVVNGSAQRGFTMALAAALPSSESSFAKYLNYSWAAVPAGTATFNRTNASATTATFTGTGAVSIQLTVHLRATAVVFYENLTIATGGSTNSLLSGTTLYLLIAIVVVVIVAVAVVVVLRGRRVSPPPAAPMASEAPPTDDGVEAPGEEPAPEATPDEPPA